MGCGGPPRFLTLRDQWRARAVRCQFCLSASHDSGGMWDGTAVACTVLGMPIESIVMASRPLCPKGRHNDYQPGIGGL